MIIMSLSSLLLLLMESDGKDIAPVEDIIPNFIRRHNVVSHGCMHGFAKAF